MTVDFSEVVHSTAVVPRPKRRQVLDAGSETPAANATGSRGSEGTAELRQSE